MFRQHSNPSRVIGQSPVKCTAIVIVYLLINFYLFFIQPKHTRGGNPAIVRFSPNMKILSAIVQVQGSPCTIKDNHLGTAFTWIHLGSNICGLSITQTFLTPKIKELWV